MHVIYINILENYQKERLTSTLQRAVKFELTTELRKIYINLLKNNKWNKYCFRRLWWKNESDIFVCEKHKYVNISKEL